MKAAIRSRSCITNEDQHWKRFSIFVLGAQHQTSQHCVHTICMMSRWLPEKYYGKHKIWDVIEIKVDQQPILNRDARNNLSASYDILVSCDWGGDEMISYDDSKNWKKCCTINAFLVDAFEGHFATYAFSISRSTIPSKDDTWWIDDDDKPRPLLDFPIFMKVSYSGND